ncbi:Acid phosphatase-like protein 2 [Mortierella sp. 14UC]|nr:Acid phosphatase-like protein 2 [Mortierella sp. 14UC]
MRLLCVSLASVAFLALQAAAQIGEYNPIYSDYDYCQGITPTTRTYQPMAGATLKKVQLFMRHGDRAPSMVFPGDDANYNLCGNSLESHFSGDDLLSRTPTVQPKIMNPHDSPYSQLLWKGNCDIAQLTNRGKQQTFNVGKSIRSIYVDLLKFLPKILNSDILYVRNTFAVRTRESAEHMLNGLYPSLYRVPGTVVEMNAYPEAVENIIITRGICPALPDLFKPFTATPTFLNFFKSNYPLMVKTNNILGVANNPSYNNSLNGDFFISRLCNNMPLPCSRTNTTDCITPAEAIKAIAGSWVMSYGPMRYGAHAEKAKRVSGGTFVGTIPKNIRATLNGDTSSRPFEFFSVHDQSIDQILAIVSSPDVPWPGYASTLLFETWQLADKSYVVRAIYEGKSVQAHPDLKCSLDACPLDVFAAFLESFVPSDPKAECGF